MTLGDYQQNYADLHARALASRGNAGPVVNSEYLTQRREGLKGARLRANALESTRVKAAKVVRRCRDFGVVGRGCGSDASCHGWFAWPK